MLRIVDFKAVWIVHIFLHINQLYAHRKIMSLHTSVLIVVTSGWEIMGSFPSFIKKIISSF